ncbi:MAG TPA: hypothetical protein VEJ63_19935 [Planctomycetota bacterium]|nr:hypothetical protein [Planctomycetota bacterium]
MFRAVLILVAASFASSVFALDFPKVGERTCTLTITKIKRDKKDRVTVFYGHRRTDKKKTKIEIEVNWKKIDKDSRTALEGAEKGEQMRIVYAWGFTGRYLVKAREFTEKQIKEEDEKIAAGEIEEGDDADADDDEGEQKAGKKVTTPKSVDEDPAEEDEATED